MKVRIHILSEGSRNLALKMFYAIKELKIGFDTNHSKRQYIIVIDRLPHERIPHLCIEVIGKKYFFDFSLCAVDHEAEIAMCPRAANLFFHM